MAPDSMKNLGFQEEEKAVQRGTTDTAGNVKEQTGK